MNFWNILAALGSICSILGLIYSVVTSKDTLKRKIISFILLFVMAVSIGGAVYLKSELKRIKDVHNKAESVYRDYDGTFYNEYIQEVLTFLEENQDRYRDSYERAKDFSSKMKESDERYVADKMHGIIKGIIVNNKK